MNHSCIPEPEATVATIWMTETDLQGCLPPKNGLNFYQLFTIQSNKAVSSLCVL